jgi:hypothetical protein
MHAVLVVYADSVIPCIRSVLAQRNAASNITASNTTAQSVWHIALSQAVTDRCIRSNTLRQHHQYCY